jgi:hypothetical protein
VNFPHGESVAVLTAGTVTDPYSGETMPDWSTATEVTIDGVAVEPRPSQEPVQDARNAVVSGYTLYLPAGAQIDAQARVRVRGEVYEVLGDPAAWRNPFTGWEPGVVMQVGRTEG